MWLWQFPDIIIQENKVVGGSPIVELENKQQIYFKYICHASKNILNLVIDNTVLCKKNAGMTSK